MEKQHWDPREIANRPDLVCQEGQVTGIDGDRATIRLDTPSSCSSCAQKGSCVNLSDGGRMIDVRNDLGAKVGQHVVVGVQPEAVLNASVLFFVFPIIALLGGLFGGYWFAGLAGFDPQWSALGVGAAAFFVAFLIIRLASGRLEKSGRYEAVITEIIE
jgi:sigma-E factor negative regulatory protein RseC